MLTLTLIIPLLSIITIVLFCATAIEIFYTALAFSILNLLHGLTIFYCFDSTTAAFQFVTGGILGIDGISLWLVLLVQFIMPIVILSSWKSVEILTKTYIVALISIGILTTASFIVIDLLLFYISFEAVLIPMYLLINIFGTRNRKIHAANMLFLYTLFGSLFMLIGVVLLYLETGSSNYEVLMSVPISPAKQIIIWVAFFIAFATKIPTIPLHIWLPKIK